MKGLLIFPPQWYPGNPYPALPLLLGQLKESDFNAEALDVNIDFFNYILTKKHIASSAQRAKALYSELSKKETLNENEQKRFRPLKAFFEKHSDNYIRNIAESVEDAVQAHKDAETFYDCNKLFKARRIVFDALELVSLEYSPYGITFFDCSDRRWSEGYEALFNACCDKATNMFLNYYESYFPKITEKGADYYIITVADITQIVSAFTLARLVKRGTGKPVCIGGNIITKLLGDFRRYPEIFSEFCDYICFGPGEKSVCELAGYLEGRIGIGDVHGLMYLKDGKVQVEAECRKVQMDTVCPPDFSGIDFRKYFSPETVWSIQFSRGCYWGKCAFCDVSINRTRYSLKTAEQAADEIAFLIDRYNIRSFLISDDSISPSYFQKLSELILERGLKVHMFSMARFEDAFSDDLLRLMHKAGFEVVFWGYEAEAERVMSLINKGINVKNRPRILKSSQAAGIWNHVAFLVGFPTETREEAVLTNNYIRDNEALIDSCYISRFSFKRNAEISKKPEKYDIDFTEKPTEISLDMDYRARTGMDENEKRELIRSFRLSYLKEHLGSPWPYLCSDFEYLLLYLSKYGRDNVRELRLDPETGIDEQFLLKL